MFFILLCSYLFLFPRPMSKEFIYQPVWSRDLHIASIQPIEGPVIDFRLGNFFGYVHEEGEISVLDRVTYDVVMDEERYINYSSVSDHHVFLDTTGQILMSVETRGYPILSSGRYFTLRGDMVSLSERDDEGELLWSRDFQSIITGLAVNKEFIALGFLDGDFLVLNSRGEIISDFQPAGSRIRVVYGVALSDDSRNAAIISGIGPQKLSILEQRNGTFIPIFNLELEDEFRRPVYLGFSDDGAFVGYETSGGIKYLDFSTGSLHAVEFPGDLLSVNFPGKGSLTMVVSRHNEWGTLQIFEPGGEYAINQDFLGSLIDLKRRGKTLYLGIDNRIERIDMVER